MVSKLQCFLCQADLGDDPEEYWCFGCKKYICEMHSIIFGRHKPEDHDEDNDH